MKKVTLILLSLTITLTAGWWKTYEGEEYEEGRCVQQTDDSGFVVTGRNWTLLKTDSLGSILWSRDYGSGSHVQQTSDGGYIIAGIPDLLKTDANGDSVWAKDYGILSRCVQETSDGGFIMVGDSLWGSTFGESQVGLVKTDVSGNTIWIRTYLLDGWLYSWGTFVRETSDGGYIIVGTIGEAEGEGNDTVEKQEVWLIKTDSNGEILWSRIHGRNQWEDIYYGRCVQETTDGGYIVLANVGLIKTDELGDTVWAKSYGAYFYGARGGCVEETPDGGYILVADNQTPSYDYDIILIKTNAEGDSLWTRTYGQESSDNGRYLNPTNDNGYVLTGGFGDAVVLIKTDSLGLLAVEEPVTPPVTQDWQVLSPVGREIVLMFNESSSSLTLQVFDAAGRLVDELRVPQTGGTITWGEGYGAGVYFIRIEGDASATTHKVILIH